MRTSIESTKKPWLVSILSVISMLCYPIGAETSCAYVIDETCYILSVQIKRILAYFGMRHPKYGCLAGSPPVSLASLSPLEMNRWHAKNRCGIRRTDAASGERMLKIRSGISNSGLSSCASIRSSPTSSHTSCGNSMSRVKALASLP